MQSPVVRDCHAGVKLKVDSNSRGPMVENSDSGQPPMSQLVACGCRGRDMEERKIQDRRYHDALLARSMSLTTVVHSWTGVRLCSA